MLDIEQIRQLVAMMVDSELTELSLRDGDIEVNLRRPSAHAGGTDAVVLANGQQLTGASDPAAVAEGSEPEDESELVEIKSPLVGSFYTAPNPDSPPYVNVGSKVTAGTVVCILEAMKVFNEIKSEIAGTIERVLVRNESAVEFGQPLFLVRMS